MAFADNSFNNRRYDPCAYSQFVSQSVSPLSYIINPVKYENVNKCRVELGLVGGTAVSHIKGNLVDLENNLFGIDRPSTHCDAFQHQPSAPGAILQGACKQNPTCGAPCYKTESYPKFDTTLNHLSSCQFNSYPAIPMPDSAPAYSCK